jgi:hypothetical protein
MVGMQQSGDSLGIICDFGFGLYLLEIASQESFYLRVVLDQGLLEVRSLSLQKCSGGPMLVE